MKKTIQSLNFVLIIACLMWVSGCATPPQPVKRAAQFIESEYAPYGLPGTSTITGQAFLKTRGGDVKFGAGNIVALNPVTSYSTEWYEKYVIQGLPISHADPRADKYLWKTIADGNGNFHFSNLPAGDYYLMCSIRWEVPSEYGLVPSGGIAHARVTVAPNKEVKVVLTR
jgi:hypothetical protein